MWRNACNLVDCHEIACVYALTSVSSASKYIDAGTALEYKAAEELNGSIKQKKERRGAGMRVWKCSARLYSDITQHANVRSP